MVTKGSAERLVTTPLPPRLLAALWLIRWAPQSRASLHDHGDSAGVLYVVAGELVEYQPDGGKRSHLATHPSML